jgi:hypothetical protein
VQSVSTGPIATAIRMALRKQALKYRNCRRIVCIFGDRNLRDDASGQAALSPVGLSSRTVIYS